MEFRASLNTQNARANGRSYDTPRWNKGNQKNWGIHSFKSVPQYIVSAIDEHFKSESITDYYPSQSQAKVKLLLNRDSGVSVAYDSDQCTERIQFAVARPAVRVVENLFPDTRETISSVTVPFDTNWKSAIYNFLELGMWENVPGLREYIMGRDFLGSGIEIERRQLQNRPYALIPGKFKHYRGLMGFQGIWDSRILYGGERVEREKRDHYIYLTGWSLRPGEFRHILLTEKEREEGPDKGNYVLSFDIPEGSDIFVDHNKAEGYVESWIRARELRLSDIIVRYFGINDPAMYKDHLDQK